MILLPFSGGAESSGFQTVYAELQKKITRAIESGDQKSREGLQKTINGLDYTDEKLQQDLALESQNLDDFKKKLSRDLTAKERGVLNQALTISQKNKKRIQDLRTFLSSERRRLKNKMELIKPAHIDDDEIHLLPKD